MAKLSCPPRRAELCRSATIEFKERKEGIQLVIIKQGVFVDDFEDAYGRERGTHRLIERLEQEEETQGQMQIRTGSLYGSIRRMLEARLIEETNERPDPELDDERRRYYGLTDFGKRVLTAGAARIAQAMAVIQGKHILDGVCNARRTPTL